MEKTKNLCAQIPISLYTQVTEGKDASGLPLREYVTAVLTEYYMMKGIGGNTMEKKAEHWHSKSMRNSTSVSKRTWSARAPAPARS